MFIHIGSSQIVFNSDLIGIFNYDLLEESTNKNILNNQIKDLVKIKTGPARPKSFIVTDSLVYTSPISPLTLSKRRNATENPRNTVC